ncbi:M20/M25/M40 family metallo-hydrolase [Aurantimonas endophytica]|uniref:Acetylornithine deacetylase/succinyl-diaminopimelate desuccinylase-like protein n=1 Tax=Aurantimonas endophytica TaxID=1522175 RepID=A0A7W6MR14_9HYPH|nr:M20/M25/M40 family metallo-hydrolase [Aurantimonas endophytica]MBB4004565.1 acetylornithine deacetylase/succinyl-diaminopimelate desuccinylase-like protein [Aurantimonas endophytica]
MDTANEPMLAPVFRHIAANEDAFVDRLIDYLRQPSISAQDIGIREVAALLETMLGAMGMDVEVVETAGHPMVVGSLPPKPGLPTILFYGHYDVQPPEPLEAWTSPPFEPTIRDGRIYARGAGDNKGQHFAQILAIESWLKVHGDLPCNVKILLEGEEEVGSPHIEAFVEANRDLLKADLVVTADGPLDASGKPVIMFGTRGAVRFDLVAREAGRDLHSGNFGGIAPNAAWTLVHLLATMKSPDGTITIDGIYDDIVPPGERERAAADALPVDLDALKREIGIRELDPPHDRPLFDRIMFQPTLTINGIVGGYTGKGIKTVIPCEARAKCDMRLVDGMAPETILSLVEDHVRRHAPGVEFVRQGGGKHPSKTDMDHPFADALIRAVTLGHEQPPLLYPMIGASGPDSAFTRILGIPAFFVPYANADERNHAPDENIGLEFFHKGIRTGAAIIEQIAASVR